MSSLSSVDYHASLFSSHDLFKINTMTSRFKTSQNFTNKIVVSSVRIRGFKGRKQDLPVRMPSPRQIHTHTHTHTRITLAPTFTHTHTHIYTHPHPHYTRTSHTHAQTDTLIYVRHRHRLYYPGF